MKPSSSGQASDRTKYKTKNFAHKLKYGLAFKGLDASPDD
jgi:hypothetical protein